MKVANSKDELWLPTVRKTGWNTALKRLPKISVATLVFEGPLPKTVRLRFAQRAIKTDRYQFAAVSGWGDVCRPEKPMDRPAPAAPRWATATKTRITPPSDIVKLDDRLFYLLQPPLESLLSGALKMPCRPFPYQLSGVSFLYPRHAAILADEMGLGKTMQAITTIRLLLHAGELRKVLLICPKPLVTNWQREFAMWAPELPVTLLQGDQTRRAWQWELPDVPVKIANYEVLLRDRELVNREGCRFDLVVLDEAQRIKNRSSESSQIVRSITRTRSWALTGTPIENTSDDLVGIFEFLAPGFLRVGMTPRRLREATRDYILRRTKSQVMTDLPPKLFRDAVLELSPEQAASYEAAESDGIVRLNVMGQSMTIQHVFELILRLKQICNFDPRSGQSSKLNRLQADLEEVADSGKKAIVFSQWVKTLKTLNEKLTRFGPVEYHGQISARQREEVIDRFRDDPNCHVILMSYGAGSVGLNLQFCEYVFLFDRWWNPAVEDQAVNRAHRIGVAGPVTVTRFVSYGTIEERIDQILRRKRELFETILADSSSPRSFGLSQEEIFGLFDLQVPES